MAAPTPRASIAGPDGGPEKPFPLRVNGTVISGFGRGSKELGIPTANVPIDSADWIENVERGVYYGWAGVKLPSDALNYEGESYEDKANLPEEKKKEGWRIFPVAMSIGYNPYYKNTKRSAEGHIVAKFPADFYGAPIAISLLGYIRPEFDYKDKESLIADIEEDIAVSKRSITRPAYLQQLQDDYLWTESS